MLERAAELEVGAELVAAACGGAGGLLVVEGAPGIGKTTVLGAIGAEATNRGAGVCSAAGGELEREFPFGIVRQLFEPALRGADRAERESILAGAAHLAAPVLGIENGDLPAVAPADFATLHGLYWLTANLAAAHPLLIAVDDAHLADPASLRWLVYLTRRLEGLSVLVMLAVRSGAPAAKRELLVESMSHPLARVMTLSALSADATGHIMSAVLGREADEKFALACHAATGGNPFLVHQLAAALLADGVEPDGEAADRVAGLGPSSVSRAITARLSRLPAGAPALARAVAVLGGHAEPRHAAALAELDGSDARDATAATDALVAAHILQDERPLAFTHSIVREALYGDMGPAKRDTEHSRAARLLAEAGAGDDHVAAHLLVTRPAGDIWVAETLRTAARAAGARGAAEAAIAYLRRAVAEPPPPTDRPAVLIELGAAESAAGDPAAIEHLRLALQTADDPVTRAGAAKLLIPLLFLTGQAEKTVELVDQVIDELGDANAQLGIELELQLTAAAELDPVGNALCRGRTSSLAARVDGGSVAQKRVLAQAATELLRANAPAEQAAGVARQSLEGGHLLALVDEHLVHFGYAAYVLALTDNLAEAERVLTEGVDAARSRGAPLAFAWVLALRSAAAYRGGRLADAQADALLSVEVLAGHGLLVGVPAAAARAIDALVERAELEEAGDLLERYGLAGELPRVYTCNFLLCSRGRLRIRQGSVRNGIDDLLECGRRLAVWRHENIVPWRSQAAMGMLRDGRPDEALRLASDGLELARAFGAPREIGLSLCAVGLARGGGEGLACLREATSVLEESPARLARTHALIELGALLRRSRESTAAREPLRRGLDLAHRCGAAALEARAHQELLAAGARPRSRVVKGVDALTPSERRVAQMAREGMANRDIAQALFVTVRTVEVHLGHAYQKLGIHSRGELDGALGQRDPASV